MTLFVGEVTFRFIIEAGSEDGALAQARINIDRDDFNTDVLQYKAGSMKIVERLPAVMKEKA